jgi:hypothetical protein
MHANMAGSVSGTDGSVVCFYSTITDPKFPTVYKQTTCWTLKTGAPTPTAGNPYNITLDPQDSKGIVIGLVPISCGQNQACMGDSTKLSPTWYIEFGILKGSATVTGGWQWSMGAYQVDQIDLNSIKLEGSNCNGYPLSQIRCHVPGGRGGGGSNYCGSWSGTTTVCPTSADASISPAAPCTP